MVYHIPKHFSATEDMTRQFCIFGKGISFSLSPVIHNTAFKYHGLSCSYKIHEISVVDDIQTLLVDPAFGGASVTMPYKLEVHRFCDHVTERAQLIGAINTILVRDEDGRRTIEGDNTDCHGLSQVIRDRFPGHSQKSTPQVGWVIGAGGASRAAIMALHLAGFSRVFISNRTREKAERIAKDFAALLKVEIIDSWEHMNAHPADVVIGTVPAESVLESDFARLVWNAEGGLCIDMSYKPLQTPLLRTAQKQAGWVTADGVDVLLEQAYCQFKLWTGLDSPRAIIAKAVRQSN